MVDRQLYLHGCFVYMALIVPLIWTRHPIVRSMNACWRDRWDLLHVLGLGTPDGMRDTACLTSDIDGWRMFFMWDVCAFEGASGAGRHVLGLDFTSLLDQRLNGRRGEMGEGSGFRRHCFQLFAGARGEARVHSFEPCLREYKDMDGEGLLEPECMYFHTACGGWVCVCTLFGWTK